LPELRPGSPTGSAAQAPETTSIEHSSETPNKKIFFLMAFALFMVFAPFSLLLGCH